MPELSDMRGDASGVIRILQAKSGCLEAGGGFSQHSTGSITPELTT